MKNYTLTKENMLEVVALMNKQLRGVEVVIQRLVIDKSDSENNVSKEYTKTIEDVYRLNESNPTIDVAFESESDQSVLSYLDTLSIYSPASIFVENECVGLNIDIGTIVTFEDNRVVLEKEISSDVVRKISFVVPNK